MSHRHFLKQVLFPSFNVAKTQQQISSHVTVLVMVKWNYSNYGRIPGFAWKREMWYWNWRRVTKTTRPQFYCKQHDPVVSKFYNYRISVSGKQYRQFTMYFLVHGFIIFGFFGLCLYSAYVLTQARTLRKFIENKCATENICFSFIAKGLQQMRLTQNKFKLPKSVLFLYHSSNRFSM